MPEPHPNASIIKAWADGTPIEFRYPDQSDWKPLPRHTAPCISPDILDYRIPPPAENPLYWRVYLRTDGIICATQTTDPKLAIPSDIESLPNFACWLSDWHQAE